MKKIYILFTLLLISTLNTDAQVYPTWTQTNLISFPRNVAGQPTGIGRVSHIAFHPTDSQTMFAVSASGGVWKTTSSGKAWVSLNLDTLPVQSLACIIVNPLNPNTILVGSGDADYYGGGYSIYKTTDGGISWKNINSGMGNRLVRRMIYCPYDTSVIIAATNDGIYKSINGGNTWVKKSGTDQMRDLAWKPGNKSKVVYAVSQTAYYRSTDNGDTWTDLTTGAGIVPADYPTAKITAMCIAVTVADSNYVYILSCDNGGTNRTFNGLFRSTDGGTSFTRRSEASNPPSASGPNILGYDNTNGASMGSQGGYNLTLIAHPANKNIIYTGSQNCWRSDDGGATWKLRSCWGCGGTNGLHADHHQLLFSPFQSNPWRLYMANDGGVSRTLTNSDSIWEACSDGLSATEYYKMGQSLGYKELLLGGTQDNGLQYYFNKENLTIQGGDVADDFIYDPLLPFSSYRNRTRNSYETGNSYTNNITNRSILGASLPTGQWIADRTDTNYGYLLTNYQFLRSTNFRAASNMVNWDSISKNISNPSNAAFMCGYQNHINTNIIYLIRNDNTLIKVNNCRSATPSFVSIGLPFSTGTNVSMDMHTSRDSVLFISVYNQVYRYSINSGYAKNITYNLPNQTIWKILVHKRPNNESIYLITQYGIYYKNQTQTTWQDFSDGLPSICRITDAEIYEDGTSESVIRVSLFGRGIWQTELVSNTRANPKADFSTYKTYQMVGGQSGVYNPCDQTLLIQDQSTGTPTQRTYSISPTQGWYWLNGTGPTDRNPQVVFTGEGDFEIMQVVSRGGLSDTMRQTITMASVKKPAACNPTTTNNPAPYGMGISNFTFGNIQSGSSLSSGISPNVQDFTCSKHTTLQGGYSYPFTLTCGSAYTQNAKIYIDFNNNGVIDTATEKVYSNTSAATSFSGTIKLPALPQVADTFIRLRIMSDYNTNQMKDPCANMQYGAVEDYGLRIRRWPSPGCVSNYSINDGDTINPQNITKLTWDSAARADRYQVYIDTVPNPTKKDSIYTTTYNLPLLVPGKRYYYKIISGNIAGYAAGCSVRSFVVKDTLRVGQLYISDTLICPANSARIILSGARGSRQWQQLTASGWTNFAHNGDTLLTTQSGKYRVLVTNAPWGSGATNAVTLQVLAGTPGLWTGLKDFKWHECKNWADGQVPDSSTDVSIPQGKKVLLMQQAVCRNFRADSNTIIDQQGIGLEVYGNYSSLGKLYQSVVTMKGSNKTIEAIDTFNLLNIANGGIITIQSNIYIRQLLQLTQGMLSSGNYNLYIKPGATFSGGNQTSYIQTPGTGALVVTTSNSGMILPLGHSAYAPVNLLQVTAGKELSVQLKERVDLSGTGQTDTTAYANQTVYIQSKDTGLTADISITVPNAMQGAKFMATYCSGRYIYPQFTVNYPPQNISFTGQISFKQVKLNNRFLVGSDGFPAHTTIEYLKANYLSGKVTLNWRTAYEFMNKQFYILRGPDSTNLTVIDSMPGKSAYIAIPSDYTYIDSNIINMSPQLWYQLAAQDTAGMKVWSEKAQVLTGMGIAQLPELLVKYWPNPFNQEINIYTEGKETRRVRILAISGQELRSWSIQPGNLLQITTTSLSPGIYILEVGNARFKITKD